MSKQAVPAARARWKIPLHELILLRLRSRYALILVDIAALADKVKIAASRKATEVSAKILEEIEPERLE